MKNKILDYFSRWIVIIPLAIVFLIFLFTPQNKSENQKTIKTLKPTQTQINKKNIDLKKQQVCSFTYNEALNKAYIKDKKIFAEIVDRIKNETDYILISGDCFYNWDKGEYSGNKMCGISTYFSVFENLLNLGVTDIQSLFNQFENFSGNKLKGDQKEIINSIKCEQKQIPEFISFEIPKNILFKNMEIK